jgi:hypothetical protein
MLRVVGSTVFLVALAAVGVSARGPAEEGQGQKQKKSQQKSRADSMTGCIDQQDGRYVLIDQKSREAIADLQAEGFETEGFAKYVGQKVNVRGTRNPATDRPLFRVRTVEVVSETCEPQAL